MLASRHRCWQPQAAAAASPRRRRRPVPPHDEGGRGGGQPVVRHLPRGPVLLLPQTHMSHSVTSHMNKYISQIPHQRHASPVHSQPPSLLRLRVPLHARIALKAARGPPASRVRHVGEDVATLTARRPAGSTDGSRPGIDVMDMIFTKLNRHGMPRAVARVHISTIVLDAKGVRTGRFT